MLTRSMPSDPAALAAAEEAFHNSTIEIWTLFAVGFTITVVRIGARLGAVGLKGLRADDYLVWAGVILYAAQSALGYSVGSQAKGLANNSMTPVERAELSVDNPEYQFRVIGSKIQIAGWTVYSGLIWSLKLSMLAFYIRLTEGLGWRYRIQIRLGFALVIATFIATLITILAACRPFHKYWQINPSPGNVCMPAISKPVVWVSFTANILTDIYLILIPLPMLWRSTLKTIKKIASSIILGAGIFVLVCATLKSIFVLIDDENGAELAGKWGIREAFVCLIVTNLPMIFPLIRTLLTPIFGKVIASTQKKTSYKSPAGVQSIGGGRGSGYNPRNAPSSDTANSSMLTGSEDQFVSDTVKMQDLQAYAAPTSVPGTSPSGGIMVHNSINVHREDRGSSHDEERGVERVREAC